MSEQRYEKDYSGWRRMKAIELAIDFSRIALRITTAQELVQDADTIFKYLNNGDIGTVSEK